MLKKVKLYGELAEKYGKDWSLDISSPVEAFKALAANNKGFRNFVSNSEERGVGYKVIVGKSYINDYSELGHPSGRQSIKIVPVVLGAKNRGLGLILVGALLLGAVFFAGGGFAQAAVGGLESAFFIGSASPWGAIAMKLGGALILGGISSLLAPTPEVEEDQPTNYGFDGATNTTKQGYAIPVCYGQLLVGGAVISSGIQPEDYVPE